MPAAPQQGRAKKKKTNAKPCELFSQLTPLSQAHFHKGSQGYFWPWPTFLRQRAAPLLHALSSVSCQQRLLRDPKGQHPALIPGRGGDATEVSGALWQLAHGTRRLLGIKSFSVIAGCLMQIWPTIPTHQLVTLSESLRSAAARSSR